MICFQYTHLFNKTDRALDQWVIPYKSKEKNMTVFFYQISQKFLIF